MSFWVLQFPPKNKRKQVHRRFHSSKVEFVRSFFGGNVGSKKPFRLFLTFNYEEDGGVDRTVIDFWQHQLGQMADFLPRLTIFVFDL